MVVEWWYLQLQPAEVTANIAVVVVVGLVAGKKKRAAVFNSLLVI